ERLRRRHSRGVDLDADDFDVVSDAAQPLVQLERRRRGCPVPEVDDNGMLGVPQRGELPDPPVDAAEPVVPGRSAGDLADGHAPIVPRLRGAPKARPPTSLVEERAEGTRPETSPTINRRPPN